MRGRADGGGPVGQRLSDDLAERVQLCLADVDPMTTVSNPLGSGVEPKRSCFDFQ